MAAHLAALDSTASHRSGYIPAPMTGLRGTANVVALTGARAPEADPFDTMAETQAIGRDQMLFSEGDPARNVYRVVSGTIRLCKLLPDGRRQIIGFLQHGDMMGLSLAQSYLYTAEAVTAAVLQRIPRTRFEMLMDEQPALARRLLSLTATELVAAQDQMVLLGRKTAVERVATFLLRLAARTIGGGRRVQLPMSRADIADHLGLTTETVSRAFTKLKTSGMIRLLDGHLVELTDREGLASAAESA